MRPISTAIFGLTQHRDNTLPRVELIRIGLYTQKKSAPGFEEFYNTFFKYDAPPPPPFSFPPTPLMRPQNPPAPPLDSPPDPPMGPPTPPPPGSPPDPSMEPPAAPIHKSSGSDEAMLDIVVSQF